MKPKYKTAMTAAFAILSLALLAAETRFPKGSKVYLLKSGGDTVAELRVKAGAECEITRNDHSGPPILNPNGTLTESVQVVLKIGTGTNWFRVSAEDILNAPEAK
jgi:hypothetical protein